MCNGQAVSDVALHGDPHARNFIFGHGAVVGIDMTGRGMGVAAFDVARFVTRLIYHFKPLSADQGYLGLAPAHWQAIAQGYGVDLQRDPVFLLYFSIQIFEDWMRVAETKDRCGGVRTVNDFRRLSRAIADAERLVHGLRQGDGGGHVNTCPVAYLFRCFFQ